MRANKTIYRPEAASVGLYWFVRDSRGTILVIARCCAVADAEQYGDFLTAPQGHYDLWEGWRAGAPPDGLIEIVRDAEYEEWPQGRVVFYRVRNQFIVYGDRQVFDHKLQHRVLKHFGLQPDHVEFSRDEHYQSTRSLHRS